MNKITLGVFLIITSILAVSIGYYARYLFMEYGKVLQETVTSTPTTVYVDEVYDQPAMYVRNGKAFEGVYSENLDVKQNFVFGIDVTKWTMEQKRGYMFSSILRLKQQQPDSFLDSTSTPTYCFTLNSGDMFCAPSDIDLSEECTGGMYCPTEIKHTQKLSAGTASWYDYSLPEYPFYSRDYDTCASRDYPRGTHLKVTAGNGKTVTCRVNDYIEHPDRQIDLSSHAFLALAPLSQGLVQVTIEEV